MAGDGGCQHSAGVLEAGKLSKTTHDKIIQNIIDSGRVGFDKVHAGLDCLGSLGIPTGVGLVPEDLHDKEKYPEFHATVMGNFEAVAKALDVKGNFSLPFPLWDPFALGLKFGLDVSFDLDLGSFPMISIPDLAFALNLKIPDLIKLDIPNLMVPMPSPFPPDLPEFKIPDFDLAPLYLDWLEFHLWPLKIPELMLSLAIPDFAISALFPPSLCPVIKEVSKAGLFGTSFDGEAAKQIATGELIVFTSKCASIAVASVLVGDGGTSGVTGTLGTKYGFREATEAVSGKEAFARQATIQAYKKVFNKEPTLKEVQFVQAVGRAENGYGRNWPLPPKGKSLPPDAASSNNWGNIQGSGPAGYFEWKGFISKNVDGKIVETEYTTKYAKWSSPVEGAMALIHELYVKRPYVHNAVMNDKSLYMPVYLMSAEAVLGKNWIERQAKSLPPDPNAMIPMSEGGLTYYAAAPTVYFNGITKSMKYIMKDLKEETDFDMVSKSSLPYDPYDWEQDLGPQTEVFI